MPLHAPPPLPPAAAAPAPCRAAQLRLSVGDGGGDLDGMSHAGVELSVVNRGPDCTLPALPTIELRDARDRRLAAVRRPPPGMHPGPVMLPVRLGRGNRAATSLRWVSGAVFPDSRGLHAAVVTLRVGAQELQAPLDATLYAPRGAPVTFDQPPFRRAAPSRTEP